jgi:hypothetical protein
LTVAILVVLFAIGTVFAPLMLVFRPGKVFQAMNRLCGAAYFGFDGKKTISATCGRRLYGYPRCRVCEWICKVLDVTLEDHHCEEESE